MNAQKQNLRHIDVRHFVKSPETMVSIQWETENPAASGSTECQAWRGQYEIEKLEKSGYKVLTVKPA